MRRALWVVVSTAVAALALTASAPAGTYVVLGGTGVFAGATCGGSLIGVGAGDGIVIHYSGTLTLP